MKGVYIFLADGFEDVEALGTNDVLRRAGLQSQLVSVGEDPFATSSHGVTVSVDGCLPYMEVSHKGTTEKDILIFPGGMPGSKTLAACKPLIKLMQDHYDAGGSVAAICAAPGTVLSQLKGIAGATVTCFDGFETALEAAGARFEPRPAIRSGRIITGRSAGHALSFALEIVKALRPEKAAEVAHALYLDTWKSE
ncbi:MAG: DJ-1/PfpI family protein [Bacteroidales bacterium]|nr:DJ-1/PfpI family protein [Bacteroidales bacterium]